MDKIVEIVCTTPPLSSILIPTISALVGALIGGTCSIFASLIPQKMQEKTANKKFLKAKLEELYYELNNWYNNMYIYLIRPIPSVFKKETEWGFYIGRDDIQKMEYQNSHFKSQILINLYFNEILHTFNKLTIEVESVDYFIHNDIWKAQNEGKDISNLQEEFNKKVISSNFLFTEVKLAILELAKKLSKETPNG